MSANTISLFAAVAPARSRTGMLALAALLGAVNVAPAARAANVMRGGQPAELTVTSGGGHSVRVTLKPVRTPLPTVGYTSSQGVGRVTAERDGKIVARCER